MHPPTGKLSQQLQAVSEFSFFVPPLLLMFIVSCAFYQLIKVKLVSSLFDVKLYIRGHENNLQKVLKKEGF